MAVMAVAALNANAQWWAGGSFGLDFSSTGKINDDKNTTSFEIAPEVGYNLNDKWAVAIALGFGTTNNSSVDAGWRNGTDVIYSQQTIARGTTKEDESSTYFSIAPYARYTICKTAPVSFFVDGGFGFKFFNHERGSQMNIGVRPGVAFSATKKLSLVATTGYLGYLKNSEKAGDGSKFLFGCFNSINFGAYYNF